VDAIADVVGLEELDLGIGVSLGRTGVPVGAGNCRVAGGIKISDLALGKVARLKNLRRLDVSGAKITPGGLKALQQLPRLERLSLWNCARIDDSAAPVPAAMSALRFLDLSYTPADDGALGALASVKQLKNLYLTDTKTTPEAVEAFRKQRGDVLVSWGRRPDPIPGGPKPSKSAKKGDDQQ
jgi:hypothetical protein